MSSTKRKFPCKCGHEAKLHESIEAPIWDQWCNGYTENGVSRFICQCSLYTPDNLKYLENEYEKNSNLRRDKI